MSATKPVHAFRDDALGDLDATALAARIRAGDISAREAAAAAIARAGLVEPHINAIHIDSFDVALQHAEKTPPRHGVFAGVPTFVKDNTDVQGLPTRHGTQAIAGAPAPRTAAFARQFLAQGFVCLG